MTRTLFLVAYDIRSPKRLRGMLRLLKEFACGGQKSAFECYLSVSEKRELIERARDLMNLQEDSLVVVPLAANRDVLTLAAAVAPQDQAYLYVG